MILRNTAFLFDVQFWNEELEDLPFLQDSNMLQLLLRWVWEPKMCRYLPDQQGILLTMLTLSVSSLDILSLIFSEILILETIKHSEMPS